MSDLIDRQAAIDLVEGLESARLKGEIDLLYPKVVKGLIGLPSAQPEVIRCKDCVHWDTSWQNDYAPDYHYCPMVDGTRKDDFYCADAERRGEQNG